MIARGDDGGFLDPHIKNADGFAIGGEDRLVGSEIVLAQDRRLTAEALPGHHGIVDRALAQRIKETSGAHTVTAAGALVNALRHLGAERIGFASPYVPEINDMAVDFLAKMGVQTVARSEVTETLGNEGQGALSPQAVLELGLQADHPQAQVIVLSCTDMRSVEIIDALEARLGKPVVTSNQAMLFQALQLLERPDILPGYGCLLKGALL